MGPHDCAIPYHCLHKATQIFKFPEDAEIKERRAIVDAMLAIGKFNLEFVIRRRSDAFDPGIHGVSPQWLDLVRHFPCCREVPIRNEFIVVQLYPCLKKFHFRRRYSSVENFSIQNGNDNFIILVSHMNVGQLVLFVCP